MTGAADDVPSATRLSRVPLRITLVALLVVLVTLALVATGAGATAMLRGYLCLLYTSPSPRDRS